MDVMALIKERFDREYPDEKNAVAYFGGVGENGKVTSLAGCGCHYRLQNLPNNTTHVYSGIQVSRCSEEDVRAFHDGLINRSGFTPLFVTRDIDEVMKQRFFVVHTNVHRNVLASCMIVSRMCKEYPTQASIVVKMMEVGVSFGLAFWFASHLRFEEGHVYISSPCHSHCAINAGWSVQTVRAFTEGKYGRKGKTFYEMAGYNDINNGWVVGNGGKNAIQLASGKIKELLVKTEHKKEYEHPFKHYSKFHNNRGVNLYKIEELVAVMPAVQEAFVEAWS